MATNTENSTEITATYYDNEGFLVIHTDPPSCYFSGKLHENCGHANIAGYSQIMNINLYAPKKKLSGPTIQNIIDQYELITDVRCMQTFLEFVFLGEHSKKLKERAKRYIRSRLGVDWFMVGIAFAAGLITCLAMTAIIPILR